VSALLAARQKLFLPFELNGRLGDAGSFSLQRWCFLPSRSPKPDAIALVTSGRAISTRNSSTAWLYALVFFRLCHRLLTLLLPRHCHPVDIATQF